MSRVAGTRYPQRNPGVEWNLHHGMLDNIIEIPSDFMCPSSLSNTKVEVGQAAVAGVMVTLKPRLVSFLMALFLALIGSRRVK